MATRLFLIRHGQTNWNLKKRYCGFLDIDINKMGKMQARRLQKRLQAEKIHKVYSSDRKRAINTAKIAFKGAEIERVPGLREMHFGVLEGLTYRQIMKRHPEVYKKWLSDPFGITIPKGEPLSDFRKRIVRAIKKIISLNPNKTVAVVCHGGAISIFLTHLFKSKDFWNQIPHSASLSIVEFRQGKARVKLLDDTSHL